MAMKACLYAPIQPFQDNKTKMKLYAVVRVDDDENELEIPCGFGDKTFKWLAMVVCQRFALLAPNGTLRRRDDFRGVSEHVQQLPFEIFLESGDVPHPSCTLSDFVKDGDRVYVSLQGIQPIVTSSGLPKYSQWSSLAFKKLVNELEDQESKDNKFDEDAHEDQDPSEIETETEAKANFIRVMFESQMIDKKHILKETEKFWSSEVLPHLHNLSKQDMTIMKDVFASNWDLIREIFETNSSHGLMSYSSYLQFVNESRMFSSAEIDIVVNRILKRIIRVSTADFQTEGDVISSEFDVSKFSFSLILLAQSRFHDIFEKKTLSLSGGRSVQELFTRYICPFATRMSFNSILKKVFCSSPVLAYIRDRCDLLFDLYQKYMSKAKDVPTALKLEIMAELLYDAGLQRDEDFDSTRIIHQNIRRGTLFPREIVKESDFSFPEYVEAITRAGYSKYRSDENDIDERDIQNYYFQAIDAAMTCLNKPESNVRRYYY